MKFSLSILFFFYIFLSYSQEVTNRFIVTDRVDKLLEQRAICFDNSKTSLKYYHIQLYNGQSIDRARSVKSDFMSQFPETTAIVEWESPEFKVWIGEYETKLAADQALMKIKKTYPNAFIVNPKK